MNWSYHVYGLKLHGHEFANQNIYPVGTVQVDTLVLNWQLAFSPKPNTSQQ
jgi:hypothetical protein